MTLNAIKSMFVTGDKWTCRRVGEGFTINGNGVKTFVPHTDVTEVRTVKVAKTQLIWTRDQGNALYTDWPKAAQVIMASPGFLQFRYDNGVEVTFTKLP